MLLLPGTDPLRAQWSGSIDLAGGYGIMPPSEEDDTDRLDHGLVQGSVKLKYKHPSLVWSAVLDGRWEPKDSETRRGSLKDQVAVTDKIMRSHPVTAGFRSDLSWTPAPSRQYDSWIRYQYRHDRGENETSNMSLGLENLDINSYNYYYERPLMNEHGLSGGVKTRHQLGGPWRELQSAFSVETAFNRQVNGWFVYKSSTSEAAGWIYQITPDNTDLNTSFQVHLRDSVLRGKARLVLDPGLRLETLHDLDHNSGATLDVDVWMDEDKEVWIDSVRLRERFDFLTVKAEPYLAAALSWKSLEVNADYGLQFHGRRLNDDDHHQPLSLHGIYPVGKGSLRWRMGRHHRLSLNNSLSVTHPDYFQICWYERTGGYLNQLYRGNEKLPSTLQRTYGLGYDFSTSHFNSSTSFTLTRKVNETDQTWTEEEIEGRLYKVFTWTDAADSWALGIAQKLGYEGKYLSAHAGVVYNLTERIARDSGKKKDATDWTLTADAEGRLGRGWTVKADARYRSKVATFFSIFGEYCVLNARIQKQWKDLTIYVEGRDLLDGPRTTSFESVDHSERWLEITRSNRRLVVLGLKWAL